MYRILCFEKPPDNNGLLPLTQCLAQPCQKKKKKKRNLQFPGRAWRRILPAREAGSAQFKSEPAAASLTKCEMWMVFLSWCVSQLTHPPSPHHYKLGMGRPIMTCGPAVWDSQDWMLKEGHRVISASTIRLFYGAHCRYHWPPNGRTSHFWIRGSGQNHWHLSRQIILCHHHHHSGDYSRPNNKISVLVYDFYICPMRYFFFEKKDGSYYCCR